MGIVSVTDMAKNQKKSENANFSNFKFKSKITCRFLNEIILLPTQTLTRIIISCEAIYTQFFVQTLLGVEDIKAFPGNSNVVLLDWHLGSH